MALLEFAGLFPPFEAVAFGPDRRRCRAARLFAVIWALHSKSMLMKPASIVASLGKYNMTCPFRAVNRVSATPRWISDPMHPKPFDFIVERPPLWLNLD